MNVKVRIRQRLPGVILKLRPQARESFIRGVRVRAPVDAGESHDVSRHVEVSAQQSKDASADAAQGVEGIVFQRTARNGPENVPAFIQLRRRGRRGGSREVNAVTRGTQSDGLHAVVSRCRKCEAPASPEGVHGRELALIAHARMTHCRLHVRTGIFVDQGPDRWPVPTTTHRDNIERAHLVERHQRRVLASGIDRGVEHAEQRGQAVGQSSTGRNL